MKCRRHPKYKAVKPPRSACETCWALWFGASDKCIDCGCQESFREAAERFGAAF